MQSEEAERVFPLGPLLTMITEHDSTRYYVPPRENIAMRYFLPREALSRALKF